MKTDWSENKNFERANKKYIDNQNLIISKVKELMERKGSKLKGNLLDIGCGDGSFTTKIAESISFHPYGIDFVEKYVEKAKSSGISAQIADINKNIPFDDSSFDLIITNQVIEHIIDTDNFFREIHRLLKPEGYAIISCPNISSLHNLGLMTLGMQPISFHSSEIQIGNPLYGTKTGEISSGARHIKIFTMPALRDLSKYHGFKVENVWGSGHYYIPNILSRFLSKLTPRYSIYIGIAIKK